MSLRLCVLFVLAGLCVLLLQLEPCEAQLTQSLGWGSAGSPGKRATASSSVLRACTSLDDMMEDLMILIEREAARQRMCRERRK